MAQNTKSPNRGMGEGNREADERYREETKRFIASGQVGPAAEDAKRALEEDAEELEDAEEEGRSRVAEEDPQVSRR
ncbi:MAG TPA: hypothetical protein VGF45_04500 [Polyangia bacterium]